MFKRLLQHIRRSWLIGAAAFLLVCNISVVWLVEYASGGLQEGYNTADKMRQATWSLLIGLLNAETGVRGFVITGDELYLGPYRMGTGSIGDQLRILELYPAHTIIRNFFGSMTRKLSVTSSQ
jgi:CHASE3 domain sensor protein